MNNDSKALPLESKEIQIKKEIEYLRRQFPWKSEKEIAAVFSKTGDVNREALKRLSTVHVAAVTVDD
ncbi:MAG: hypothetical protein ACTHLE_01080 [Agriterribacter sp.]